MIIDNRYYKLIKQGVKQASEELSKNPFEWTVNEIEAQVRMYNILQKLMTNNESNIIPDIDMRVENIGNERKNPIPKYNHPITPLRLECLVRDANKEIRKPDICIVNGEYSKYITEKEVQEDSLNRVIDVFIEIKVAWGYCAGQFDGEGIVKDLRLMSMYPDKGCFIYFIGNNYSEMHTKEQEKYLKDMTTIKQLHKFEKDQIFLVFRDKVLNGEFKEVRFED